MPSRPLMIDILSSAVKMNDVIKNVDAWLKNIDAENDCIVSGFQSEVEKYVLENILKKHVKIICVMAKKMFNACPQKYKSAINEGRMLIISPYKNNNTVVTKENAKNRNIYVINHSQKVVVGNITPNGMIESILKDCKKPILKLT